MIHWFRRSRTCTRQIEISMRLLPGAGLRSMPWAKDALVFHWGRHLFPIFFSLLIMYGFLRICLQFLKVEKWWAAFALP